MRTKELLQTFGTNGGERLQTWKVDAAVFVPSGLWETMEPRVAAAGTEDGQSSNVANLNGPKVAETKLGDNKYEASAGENGKNVKNVKNAMNTRASSSVDEDFKGEIDRFVEEVQFDPENEIVVKGDSRNKFEGESSDKGNFEVGVCFESPALSTIQDQLEAKCVPEAVGSQAETWRRLARESVRSSQRTKAMLHIMMDTMTKI